MLCSYRLSFAPVRKTTPNAVPYMQSACEPIRLAGAFFSWPHVARTPPLVVIFPTYWKKSEHSIGASIKKLLRQYMQTISCILLDSALICNIYLSYCNI